MNDKGIGSLVMDIWGYIYLILSPPDDRHNTSSRSPQEKQLQYEYHKMAPTNSSLFPQTYNNLTIAPDTSISYISAGTSIFVVVLFHF